MTFIIVYLHRDRVLAVIFLLSLVPTMFNTATENLCSLNGRRLLMIV